jgi:tRNA/tmRNA/rRNA uracil-C5-methylase (TrmA/RlmC/RlmD family)
MITSVYIAKNVYGGDGLGRLGDGRVVFVPGAWAGEQVRAEIVEEKRNFVRAKLIEILEPSPERINPGLTVPGMVYAGLSRKGEVAAKAAQLAEFFERARISVPEIVAPSTDEPFLNYRNKVVYHFEKVDGRWVIGYRAEPEHIVVDVEQDPLAVPEINAKLPEIRMSVLALLTTGPKTVQRDVAAKGSLTIRWTKKTGVKWWVGEPVNVPVLKETAAGLSFEVPPDGFWQMNPVVCEKLVSAVADLYLRGASIAPDIVDLYCGVGVLGLAAAKKARDNSLSPRLIGIESGRKAVEFAKRNAASQGARDCQFFSERVGPNIRRLRLGEKTTVILDPPRSGLEMGVARVLVNSKCPRVIYVSCDPATLTRDLRVLSAAFDVKAVSWFDMFPRTARFETLVCLERR